jgi:hypothetical protein
MAFKSLLISLLASSLLPATLAAPTAGSSIRASPENLFKARSESCPDTGSIAPHFFTGPVANFPSISQWVTFDSMVNIYYFQFEYKNCF